MTTNSCVVVILTFNSANIIRETLTQALKVSPNIFVVDSGSKDDTPDIARAMGCVVIDRAFVNYSDQRNWAIEQISSQYEWQLHLDADEVLDEVAIAAINKALNGERPFNAYLIKRRDYFMGRMLRFSGVNPWHLRLFKSGFGQCENRLYDQHFVATCPTGNLSGLMHDKNASSMAGWTASHNRWSDLEADQIMAEIKINDDVLQPRLLGDARERTRFIKGLYYKLPIGLRALSYFIYRYLFRLGFLDGVVGFYFAFFQAFWFRMLVDAKIYEKNLSHK
ncbi:glycosyltransferase family 2 protein [Methylobacter psychrophilus]|uniref:glycosyltransferase family 2 protein n=1 Tax=Methylobacter psychrophilus TaxID=96941 RepID=UPI0021D4A84C|nr:glycosyltransferase family 2 protein [Methylobacter psychrophilus]